jgi:hypothetical protein
MSVDAVTAAAGNKLLINKNYYSLAWLVARGHSGQ